MFPAFICARADMISEWGEITRQNIPTVKGKQARRLREIRELVKVEEEWNQRETGVTYKV